MARGREKTEFKQVNISCVLSLCMPNNHRLKLKSNYIIRFFCLAHLTVELPLGVTSIPSVNMKLT